MVSGSETALATVQPLLDVMARNAPVVGTEPGEGQKVKLVNQLLCGVHIAVAAEALAYAEALGLNAGATWEVLRHGAAASFMLDDRGARMVDNPNNDIRSTIDIFVKDMDQGLPHPPRVRGRTALPRRPPRRSSRTFLDKLIL
jgi:3-hydroxyisobutyrate dehydrogenase/putative dehydrogenase